jgi:hypothetical protein
MNDEHKLVDTSFLLRNLSSALGLLKGSLEDDEKHLSSEFAEQAQDLIDEAVNKVEFAIAALDETADVA